MADHKVINVEFPDILPSIHLIKCPKCGGSQVGITGVKGVMSNNVVAGVAAGGLVGEIVSDVISASQEAKKPAMPLSTIRFLCEDCGEKFEAEPHATNETDILESPFSVTYTRKGLPFEDIHYVFINGVLLSNTPHNLTVITFNTSVRHNTIFSVGSVGKIVSNGKYTFQASPGGSLNLLYTKKQFNVL